MTEKDTSLSEKTDLHRNKFRSSFATSLTKSFFDLKVKLKMLALFLSILFCLTPTLKRQTPCAMLSKQAVLH